MPGPLGAPRKGEKKRGEVKKKHREEMTRRTGLVAPCSWICTVIKETVPTANPSNKTPAEAKKRNLLQLERGL